MSVRVLCACLAVLAIATPASAQKKYDPGASDTEIKIGQTMPFGGPVSAAGTVGHASIAYFETLNRNGGINGRKIALSALDDGYSPPKAVELTRKLVESEKVLLLYGSVGTPTNAAVQKYLNAKKVPQLFIATGASRFKDPKTFPWTVSMLPSYEAEGKALARYVLQTVTAPKIAIVYQNDDLGKDFAHGFKAGLGDKAKSLIVSEQTFEVTDTTVDSQIIAAKASGANVLYFAGTQKYGAMHIRARHDLGWKPLHLVCSTSSSIQAVLKPAGFDRAEGVISTAYAKDPFDPAWASDTDTRDYLDWLKANLPQGNPRDTGYAVGYIASFMTAHVLRQAGDTLTRDNVLRIATHLKDLNVPMLLPGITAHTTPTDYSVINRFQVQRFDGRSWTRVGKVISGE
ncbi:ABC transporter substrate-binding protein [Vineibacter terrae]|uniref:ABC transporter substrate-binding protein n=1 Tax=Vineibacter terrae TaxID=2586908 RepID=A0A5C8PLL0_9HYPH|nr:ABC transporter substrate-binding protein [Vineibacter terrae]TXL74576.1 ABC transporter substrate-binding protein [Vineibacter terrae]